MLKDMYNERGILKPEYTMTESERKAQLFNNNKLILPDYMNEPQPKVDVQSLMIKEKLNKSLKQMQEDVLKNKISLKEFEEYYTLIKNGVVTGLLDNALTYALTLSDAVVLPMLTDNDEKKYYTYMKDLEDIIANEIRKSLGADVLILENRLNGMLKTINQYVVTLKQYYAFCETLQYAMMAKIEGINYLECAKALQNAKIESPKAYDEYIKLHNFKKKIASIVSQLEQPEKGKSRK